MGERLGLAAFLALANHITAHPELAEHLDVATEVVAELEEVARVLVMAVSERIRFRLEMS